MLALCCCCLAFAQPRPTSGGGGLDDFPTVKVTIAPQLKVLQWNTGLHSQDAQFTATVTVTHIPAGWSSTGQTSWQSGSGTQGDQNLKLDSLTGTSVSGHGYEVGGYFTSGAVKFINPFGATYWASNVDWCAAFGGKISFQINAGSLPTWSNDQNDPTKPYYIQYFYNPALGPGTDGQLEQTTTALVSGQLSGTKMTWTIGTLYTTNSLVVTGTGSSVMLTANSAGTSTISCQFQATWTNPKTLVVATATGSDDTATSERFYGGAWIAASSKVDAHKPGSLVQTMPISQDWLPQPGSTGWYSAYQLTLLDTAGGAMPGVYVNEHFTTALPPNYGVNTNLTPWSTITDTGDFNTVDNIGYYWLPPVPAPYVEFLPIHEYWAGTQATDGRSGIRVATCTIDLKSGDANNNPTKASANQSAP